MVSIVFFDLVSLVAGATIIAAIFSRSRLRLFRIAVVSSVAVAVVSLVVLYVVQMLGLPGVILHGSLWPTGVWLTMTLLTAAITAVPNRGSSKGERPSTE
jgi:hypothetical protein